MSLFKSDILYSGFYGQNNTGDDAFVEVYSWASKKYFKTDNHRFLSTGKKLPKTLVRVSMVYMRWLAQLLLI